MMRPTIGMPENQKAYRNATLAVPIRREFKFEVQLHE
jgi:hypothetical protein